MTKTDLSTEALLVRREISEKATPGPWGVKCERHDNTCHEYLILTEDGDKIVGADKIDLREVYYRNLPEAICSLDSHDAAHIAANSPDVVIATIDELLRLRAENGRLKEGLENALHVNELRLAEVAKTLFTGIVEGISGDSESVMVQAGATCVHCNGDMEPRPTSRAPHITPNDVDCKGCPERQNQGLVWSAKPPTVPGWYWYQRYFSRPRIVQIMYRGLDTDRLTASFAGNEEDEWVEDMVGRWAGPISMPEGLTS